MREFQFDGLVGPTHNYGGLSPGNLASTLHAGQLSNPRAAALQGLAKIRFVSGLGVPQAVLPPQDRPSLGALRRLGFRGTDEQVIVAAASGDGLYLRLCSSASSMWAANAATVAPSCDTADGRVYLTPANLCAMFHRSVEAETTARALRTIFADSTRFVVNDPLPGGSHFADEGAANHTRLATSVGAAHVFAWGRRAWDETATRHAGPHPARQTLEASQAIARLHGLGPGRCIFAQQHPEGIDRGAFHTDVLAVGNGRLLIVHELAFAHLTGAVEDLKRVLGDELVVVHASNQELPVERAVAAYPFNSQLLTLPNGSMAIVAPEDAHEDRPSREFLERLVTGAGPIQALYFVDVRQSMQNGGGPACLRLRVPLEDDEAAALSARVVVDAALVDELEHWVRRHYRDRLAPADLADPELAREGMRALDELTTLLDLGSIYDFQRGAALG
jgi:succinylarginine dihydrolase